MQSQRPIALEQPPKKAQSWFAFACCASQGNESNHEELKCPNEGGPAVANGL